MSRLERQRCFYRLRRWVAGCALGAAVGGLGACQPESEPQSTLVEAPALHDVPATIRDAHAAPLVLEGGLYVNQPAWPRARALGAPVRVEIPLDAGGSLHVEDLRSGVAVVSRWRAAQQAGATRSLEDGKVVERSAAGDPTALLRATPSGVEDYVRVADPGAEPQVSFDMDVTRVAGLRLRSSVLELLDADGIPRLRAHRPVVVDADGRSRSATLDVEGCAMDRSAAPPWRRAVTAPGSATCTLVVRWAAQGLRYPIWVDPYWASTSNELAWGHFDGSPGVRLADGTVLYLGGQPGGGDSGPLATERFDPVSDTWAVTGDTLAYYPANDITLLADGRVLFVTAEFDVVPIPPVAQLYDPLQGTWRVIATPPTDHDSGPLVAGLIDGRALYIPATSDSVSFLFEPATETWVEEPGRQPRTVEATTRLNDGSVLLLGWASESPFCERYRPQPGGAAAWLYCGGPGAATYEFAVSHVADDDSVFIIGGHTHHDDARPEQPLFVGYRYLPAEDDWAGIGELPDSLAPRVALVDGTRMIAGGQLVDSKGGLSSTLVFEEAGGGGWVRGPALLEGRSQHLGIVLADGRTLVAGGLGVQSAPLRSAEVLLPGRALGEPCDAGSLCESTFCAGGVCCDAACEGSCNACTAFGKVSGVDGTCGAARACSDACASNADCPAGRVCSADRACVEPEPTADGGGGCASSPGGWGSWSATAMAAAAMAARCRRRRGRRSAATAEAASRPRPW
ncbi:MAG: hypothetical protein WKG00_12345 [Polyangiaceae bacterium]